MNWSRIFFGNWEAAVGFAALGWATAGLLLLSGRSSKYVMLPAYFALMQTIQVLQFAVLGQCSSKANQLLTLLSYAHIAFQPAVFNEFIWGQPQAAFNRPVITPYADSVMHKSVRKLSLAGAGLMLLKAAPAVARFLSISPRQLSNVVGWRVADLISGTATWCDRSAEMLCARQLCSFPGRTHIGWSMPLLPSGYFVPTGFLHMFLMFGPAIILGGTSQRVVALTALLTGPLAASSIVGGSERAGLFEWAAIWSSLAVVQVLLLLLVELMVAKAVTGKCRLPQRDQRLGQYYYEGQQPEAETEATAVIHLYQQQLAGYKQQLGGYGKMC